MVRPKIWHECPTCGKEYFADPLKLHCPRAKTTIFCGVDGEGYTDANGVHHYVLLSIGDESITNDEPHLQWWEIFSFLHDYGTEHPKEVLVGFYLGYDFTNWVRTLSEERARMLLTDEGIAKRRRTVTAHLPPFPVRATAPDGIHWEFDSLPNRRFKVRPEGGKWVYVCDTGAFWQCSFLKAIDPDRWPRAVCSDDDYQTIFEGKAARSTAVLGKDMIRYNITENRVLASITGELNKAFKSVGIVLKRTQWFGPGQVAQKWLTLQNVPTREDVNRATPPEIIKAAWALYTGGWFEQFAHGHVGRGYEYDINSAYPHIIRSLPCLLHGSWESGVTAPPPGITMVHADVIGTSDVLGAMSHRLYSGRILRPQHTRGWYWLNELAASFRAGGAASYEISEWHHYKPCSCPPPMRDLASLYQKRLAVGKNSPEGVALKLIYNSVYGKFAQSVGSPMYANPIYASLITSGCRSMILDAVATHPTGLNDLLMVATDGVYFSTPHPGLNLNGERLGAWDLKVKENLTLFQPGLYWDDESRARIAKGEAPKFKSRGIGAKDLAPYIAKLDGLFADFTPGDEWPELSIPIPFALTSAKLALARGKWDTCGKVTINGSRTLASTPYEKRDLTSLTYRDGRLVTAPYAHPRWWDRDAPDEESHPYVPHSMDEEGEITPDGPLLTDIREALLG